MDNKKIEIDLFPSMLALVGVIAFFVTCGNLFKNGYITFSYISGYLSFFCFILMIILFFTSKKRAKIANDKKNMVVERKKFLEAMAKNDDATLVQYWPLLKKIYNSAGITTYYMQRLGIPNESKRNQVGSLSTCELSDHTIAELIKINEADKEGVFTNILSDALYCILELKNDKDPKRIYKALNIFIKAQKAYYAPQCLFVAMIKSSYPPAVRTEFAKILKIFAVDEINRLKTTLAKETTEGSTSNFVQEYKEIFTGFLEAICEDTISYWKFTHPGLGTFHVCRSLDDYFPEEAIIDHFEPKIFLARDWNEKRRNRDEYIYLRDGLKCPEVPLI